MEKYMVRVDNEVSEFYETISKYSGLPAERIMSIILSEAVGRTAQEILLKQSNKTPHA